MVVALSIEIAYLNMLACIREQSTLRSKDDSVLHALVRPSVMVVEQAHLRAGISFGTREAIQRQA